jgi:hypothetical protein
MKQKRLQALHTTELEKYESQSSYRISRKDNKAEQSKLLDLAMDWNCIDEAKEFIFRNSSDHILVLTFISFSCLYYLTFLGQKPIIPDGFTKKSAGICL